MQPGFSLAELCLAQPVQPAAHRVNLLRRFRCKVLDRPSCVVPQGVRVTRGSAQSLFQGDRLGGSRVQALVQGGVRALHALHHQPLDRRHERASLLVDLLVDPVALLP